MAKESQNIYEETLEILRAMILEAFKDEDVSIILFGSRARGDFNRRSDIDIGLLSRVGFNKNKLILLKEKLEDVNIPYQVDLVDISKVSAVFRDNVIREGIVWKN